MTNYFIIEILYNHNHFSQHFPLGGLQSFPSVSSNTVFYRRDLATKTRNTMAKLNQQEVAKESRYDNLGDVYIIILQIAGISLLLEDIGQDRARSCTPHP